MSDIEVLALLDKRIREAEKQILASEPFRRLKEYNRHMFMEHGSGEICSCAEWHSPDDPEHV